MRRLFAASSVLLLGACAGQQTVSGAGVGERLAARTEARTQAACPIRLSAIEDARLAGDSAGIMAGVDARMPEALTLLEDELRRGGIHRDAVGPTQVRIVLKRLYVAQTLDTKTPTAVLLHVGADGRERLVRASETTINWNGTQAEYERAMSRVLAKAVDDLVRQASEGCATG